MMVGRMEEVEKDLRDSMRGKEEAEGVVGGLRRENEMLSVNGDLGNFICAEHPLFPPRIRAIRD